MDQPALNALLEALISTWENEVVEFKQAGNDYSTNDIGKYFSALSNEANLRGLEHAWLIFGVTRRSRWKPCTTALPIRTTPAIAGSW